MRQMKKRLRGIVKTTTLVCGSPMWSSRLRSIDGLDIEHRDCCRRPEHKGQKNMKRRHLMIGAAIALLATGTIPVSSLRAQDAAATAQPPAETATPAAPRQAPPQKARRSGGANQEL
jgi:hypothetical protein